MQECGGAAAGSAGPESLEPLRERVLAALMPQGALDGAIRGFHARRSQQAMAVAVLETIAQQDTLIAEAGTGTGKTFAYLVPSLLCGGKVLISTATRHLQDQVFHKDLAALCTALDLNVKAAVLKGRANYLCVHRLEQCQQQGRLPSQRDAAYLRAIGRFARTTVCGDRSELAEVPEQAAIWPMVTSTRENCLGGECPSFQNCFVYRARREAMQADVVVVNHHLFLADLALRDDALKEFLPTADTVILDEAHQLPQIATEFFGFGWSLGQVGALASDARSVGMQQAADGAPWLVLTRGLEHASAALRLALADAGLQPGARLALDRLPARSALVSPLSQLVDALDALVQALQANENRDVELGVLRVRCVQLSASVGQWVELLTGDLACERPGAAAQVHWLSVSSHGAQFHTTPLNSGSAFARARQAQTQAWILTSATLTVAGRFDAFVAATGLTQARTERWESPFDYAKQGRLYLPPKIPEPGSSDFARAVAQAVWPVLKAAQGRAFVLCTTLRATERVASFLRELLVQSGHHWPLLVQGEQTRQALLDRFRTSGHAILVGSVSFWEGIDVRGEALSVVAIDKLPFAPPDDPVVEARIKYLRDQGGNPFMDYQLPEAITLLKQGAGRLIRGETDRGVLMLLDARVLTKPYGRTVLASLPPFQRTQDLGEIEEFFEQTSDASSALTWPDRDLAEN